MHGGDKMYGRGRRWLSETPANWKPGWMVWQEVEELRKKVEELERRVAELEGKIK